MLNYVSKIKNDLFSTEYSMTNIYLYLKCNIIIITFHKLKYKKLLEILNKFH